MRAQAAGVSSGGLSLDSAHGSTTEPALLYPVDEAAALLGIGRTNVYYLMNDGKLGSVRIGSRRLIPRAALLAFVEGLAEAS